MLNDANVDALKPGVYIDNSSYFARIVEVEGEEVSFGPCFPQRSNYLSPEGQAKRLLPFEEAYLAVVRKLIPPERASTPTAKRLLPVGEASTMAEKRLNFETWLIDRIPRHPNLESQINQALELLNS